MMPLVRFIVFANWWIAGGAALLATTTFLRFNFQINWYVIGFIFLSTLLLYSFQRILKYLYLKQHSDSYNWCTSHYKYLIFQSILALLALLPLLVHFRVMVLYAFLTAAAFSLLYLFVSPLNLKLTGLRQLPFVKSIFIASVWSVVTAIIPLLNLPQDQVNTTDISWVYLEHLIFIYALIIPFDIRDLSIDKASMRTLPQITGEKNARITGAFLLLLFLLITEILNVPRPLPVLFVFAASAVLILSGSRKEREFYYLVAVDGMLYAYALGFWIMRWL